MDDVKEEVLEPDQLSSDPTAKAAGEEPAKKKESSA
jgi:hypothetical protein